jgi:hypothetical protein
MSVTIGADPEFFIFDNRSGEYGQIIECVGLIPGTKEQPFDLGDGFAAHEDNVCAELMIPPSTSPNVFADNIQKGKKLIKDTFLKKHFAFRTIGAHKFPKYRLESKQAKHFGCEPDHDAYVAGKARIAPDSLRKGTYRFAGGHIHIGGEFNCPPFVAALLCDVWITIPSMYPLKPTSAYASVVGKERLKWYGKAGIFRPKPYGIEYRTPSNWWTYNGTSAAHQADRALRVGHWMEHNSATQIRNAVQNTDWLAVKKLIEEPPTKVGLLTDALDNIMYNLRKVYPL